MSAPDRPADLERTVIDLTARLDHERFAHANTAAKVKRVEALAEQLEQESTILAGMGDYPNEPGAIAARLRAALKEYNR